MGWHMFKRLKWPAIIGLVGTVGWWALRNAIEEWLFSSLTSQLQNNAWVIGKFLAWDWSPLVLGVILFGGCWLVATFAESRARVEKADGHAVTTSPSNYPNLKNVTITPDDDGTWAWLRVDNKGPTGSFQISVMLFDTGEKEHSYHASWRDNGAQVLEIVKGDKGTANIAEIDSLETEEKVILRFWTTANSTGEFYKTFSVPSAVHCRITVFHVDQGPVARPRDYVLKIESADRLRFFERVGMEQDEQSRSGLERTYVGEGIWWEVKWRGFRLVSGRIDADGPVCIDDDTPLRYKGFGLSESVEDYNEVRPPSSHLVCPACGKKYYLGATDVNFKRVGDARNYAAWRLGGGRTKLEKMLDSTGLT